MKNKVLLVLAAAVLLSAGAALAQNTLTVNSTSEALRTVPMNGPYSRRST